MRLNTLKAASCSKKSRKRVGRGISSGLGKTAGRGHKGLKSRSGGKVKPGFEGGQQPLQRRLPKYGFNSLTASKTAEIRLHELIKVAGDVVTITSLRAAGLISMSVTRAKIILSGSLNKALTIKGLAVTKGARVAIQAAGGIIED